MSKTITRQGYTDVFIPESSVIDTAYYDEDTQRLFVTLHNGTRVGYEGVTAFSWLTFKNYDSPGSFWNRYVKGAYRGLDGNVELYDRSSYPQSPSVDDEGAEVYSQAANAFTAYRPQGAQLTSKYHVLVEVNATDFASAVDNIANGTVKSVTLL